MAKKERARLNQRSAPLTVSKPELLSRGSDDLFRNFIHDFLAFSERVIAIRAGFGEKIGMSGVQYTVLVSVAHLQRQGPVSINMVANHLHFSGAFITTVTNQLEKLGLILKARDTVDRRQLALAITLKGEQLLSELAPIQQKVNNQLFDCLSKDDFQSVAAIMSNLVDCGDRAIKLLDYLKQPGASA